MMPLKSAARAAHEEDPMKHVCWLTLLAAVVWSGCAGVEVSRITEKNKDADGVRYYRPYPYLLVTGDPADQSKEKVECRIVYLPNIAEEYVVKVTSGFSGSVDAKIALEEGWKLTSLGDARDSKSVETITALAGLIKDAKGIAPVGRPATLKPGLYAFEYDRQTGIVTGLKLVAPF
jgi:hypothetical protein